MLNEMISATDLKNPEIIDDRRAALEAMNIGNLSISYVNWVQRLGPGRPVKVITPENFETSEKFEQYSNCISEIFERLREGFKLDIFLSRRARTKSFLLNSNPNNADKDLMLNNYGILHLHLGTFKNGKLENDDGDLLLLTIHNNIAYVPGISDHDSWELLDWAKLMHENWPDDGLLVPLNILPPESKDMFSQVEKRELRKAGASTFEVIDGNLYMSNTLGIATNGMSTRSVDCSRMFLKYLHKIQSELTNSPEFAIKNLNEKFGYSSNNYSFGARVQEGIIEVLEKNSKIKLAELFIR